LSQPCGAGVCGCGAELRLLTRATSKLAAIEGLAAEVVVGDLRQSEALRTALRGCDALVHVAADYRLWVRDPKEMYAATWMERASCCALRAKRA